MKLTSLFVGICLSALSIIPAGCKRSPSDVWEDTKTAGRQMGRGFRTLAGTHEDSRLIQNPCEFEGPVEQEYIPLRDEELSHHLSLQGNVKQASATPGEKGGLVPGIDRFSDPTTSDQRQIFQTIHFDSNEYVIRENDRQPLVKIANYMKRNSNIFLFVEGHCDKKGAAAYNLALGARRANAVRNYLVREGADPEHIFTISYGKERPIAMGDDPATLQQNRRAQFKLYNSTP